METADWQPAGVDVDTPNVARVYDYYLGGACNLEVDRKFADEILSRAPEAREFALHNRRYQHRAVRYVANQGVRQFLDLGAGIPTVGPTHEVARSVNPDARVMYVDIEPVAVEHSKLLLDGDSKAGVLQADLREPQAILGSPVVRNVLDLSQPVAVMVLAILHFLPDEDDPAGIIARYLAALPSGSWLIASHGTADGTAGERADEVAEKYQATSLAGHARTRQQFAEILRPVEIVDPGIVWTAAWRPDTPEDALQPERSNAYAAVGRKP